MSDHNNDEPPDDGFDDNNFDYNQADNSGPTGNRKTMNDDNILGSNAFKNVNDGGQNSNGFDYAPEHTNATNN